MYHVPCPSVICYGQWHHARHHTSSQSLHGYNGARLVESFRAALDTRPHPQLDINWIDMENPNTIMLPRRFVKLIESLRWSWWPSKTLSRDGRLIAVFISSHSHARARAHPPSAVVAHAVANLTPARRTVEVGVPYTDQRTVPDPRSRPWYRNQLPQL